MTKKQSKPMGKFTKTDFVAKWCETIQGNIWKNECILEFRKTLPDQNEVELDAIKDVIQKDFDTLQFLTGKYEIKNI